MTVRYSLGRRRRFLVAAWPCGESLQRVFLAVQEVARQLQLLAHGQDVIAHDVVQEKARRQEREADVAEGGAQHHTPVPAAVRPTLALALVRRPAKSALVHLLLRGSDVIAAQDVGQALLAEVVHVRPAQHDARVLEDVVECLLA